MYLPIKEMWLRFLGKINGGMQKRVELAAHCLVDAFCTLVFWTQYTALNAKLHCTVHFFCTLYTSLNCTALYTAHCKINRDMLQKRVEQAAHLEGQLVDAFCTLHTFSAQCMYSIL